MTAMTFFGADENTTIINRLKFNPLSIFVIVEAQEDLTYDRLD